PDVPPVNPPAEVTADTLRFAREVSQRQAAVNNNSPMQEGFRSADTQRTPDDVVPVAGKPVDIRVCQDGEDCMLLNLDSAQPVATGMEPRVEIFDVVPEDKVVPLNER
ncbi:hypothetical protein, partial [Escherichia coli]|uniref:hypothetical protein n=1 Tax=Escherichia coli TaxID=562 RepID=UPI0021D00C48